MYRKLTWDQRLRAVVDYLGMRRWAWSVSMLLLMLMLVLYVLESVYYVVGSVRFRDSNFGVWNIAFLVLQLVLTTAYGLLVLCVSRWYDLWDRSVRSNGVSVTTIFFTMAIHVPFLCCIQLTNLVLYGVEQDVSISSPTLPVYRTTCQICGATTCVLLYVIFRNIASFWRTSTESMKLAVVPHDCPRSAGNAQTYSNASDTTVNHGKYE